jgi:hypothetical protein
MYIVHASEYTSLVEDVLGLLWCISYFPETRANVRWALACRQIEILDQGGNGRNTTFVHFSRTHSLNC